MPRLVDDRDRYCSGDYDPPAREDAGGEALVAEKPSFDQRKSKAVGAAMCLLVLTITTVLCGVMVKGKGEGTPIEVCMAPSDAPSDVPATQTVLRPEVDASNTAGEGQS